MEGEDRKAVVGDVIDGRYRLLSMLGQGGMGQVFRAEHVGIKREVAIKLLHHELRDNEGIQERVTREAFATGRLDHPNCVSVTDSGTFGDGGTYIVMELLKGDSLGDVLDEQESLPIAQALAIVRDILKGLEHAHGVGVVHRDLKPDNIFLVQSGTKRATKILDFGIAKLLGDAKVEAGGGDLTEAGMAIGSPTYMSPEQATGEAIDGRTDLFTVSLILYEMIAGDPPFYEQDDKVRSLQRRLKEQAPPMVSARGEVIPATLEALVQAGLEKNPEHRVANAGEYRKSLEGIIAELSGASATPATALLPRIEASHPVASMPPGPKRDEASLSPEVVRRLQYGGLAVLALVVLVAAIAALSGSPESANSSEETLVMDPVHLDDAITVDPKILAAQLEQELNRLDQEVRAGRGPQYMEPIKRLRSLWPRHARTNYLLGLAYMEKRYWGDGYKYLREAVRLDETLRSDPDLMKAAIRSLSSRSKPELGEEFLVHVVGEASIPLLQETVRGGSVRQKKYADRALRRLQTTL